MTTQHNNSPYTPSTTLHYHNLPYYDSVSSLFFTSHAYLSFSLLSARIVKRVMRPYKFNRCKHLLTSLEFQGLRDIEKAVKLVRDHKAKKSVAIYLCKVSKSSLTTALNRNGNERKPTKRFVTLLPLILYVYLLDAQEEIMQS